jgi:hypothetical protein
MRSPNRLASLCLTAAVSLALVPLGAQAPAPQSLDRLRGMPGVDQFQKMQAALQGAPAVVSGALAVTWAEDGKSLTYSRGMTGYRYDLATMAAVETGAAPPVEGGAGRGRGAGRAGGAPPAAGGGQGGRGAGGAGARRAPVRRSGRSGTAGVRRHRRTAGCGRYRDRIVLSNADGTGESPSPPTAAKRTDGTASQLGLRRRVGQTSAICGRATVRVASTGSTKARSRITSSRWSRRTSRRRSMWRYPKAGSDNPIADVMVYDLTSKKTVTLDVRDGAFTNDVVGH